MYRGTKIRGIRVDEAMWAELASIAEQRGTTRTEVLLAAVEHCKKLKTFTHPRENAGPRVRENLRRAGLR